MKQDSSLYSLHKLNIAQALTRKYFYTQVFCSVQFLIVKLACVNAALIVLY